MTRRRALRLSLLAALWLLLGAVTTVGVAWWLAWGGASMSGPAQTQLGGAEAAKRGWPAPVPDDWPPPANLRVYVGTGKVVAIASDSAPVAGTGLPSSKSPHTLWVEEYGWPARAVRLSRGEVEGVVFGYQPNTEGWTFDSWRSGVFWIRSTPDSYHITQFPVSPIWKGLGIGSVMYAAGWWLFVLSMLALCRAGRHRLRVSRGMCGSCGYDLQGSTGGACPECGVGSPPGPITG